MLFKHGLGLNFEEGMLRVEMASTCGRVWLQAGNIEKAVCPPAINTYTHAYTPTLSLFFSLSLSLSLSADVRSLKFWNLYSPNRNFCSTLLLKHLNLPNKVMRQLFFIHRCMILWIILVNWPRRGGCTSTTILPTFISNPLGKFLSLFFHLLLVDDSKGIYILGKFSSDFFLQSTLTYW